MKTVLAFAEIRLQEFTQETYLLQVSGVRFSGVFGGLSRNHRHGGSILAMLALANQDRRMQEATRPWDLRAIVAT